MNVLIIDTSTEWCLIALEKAGTLTESIFRHDNHLARDLLPSMRKLLEQAQLSPKDLHAIAIGIGPGSYTGTRIGASVAKTLGFALSIPIRPFHSPLAFLPDQPGRFGFLLPTKAGTYFALTKESPQLLHVSELVTWADTVDYLVLHPTDTAPTELAHKPYQAARPNPSLLMHFFDFLPSQDAEQIFVEYFGSAVLKNICALT
jgi:tRNA threonylcarbamoyl adenosine modification protein YeaZ